MSKNTHSHWSKEEDEEQRHETMKSKNQSAEEVSEETTQAQEMDNVSESPLEENAVSANLSQENQQLQEQLARSRADFDNYKKRTIREQNEIRRLACAGLIEELLPILDNFESGLQQSIQVDKNTLSGFQMIFSQLQTLLFSKGVKEVSPQNEPFNPQQEDAIAYVDHEQIPQGYVVQSVRKGYKLHDRLLRPASVIVSKGAKEEK